jgi:hypothetical protein
MHYWWVNQNQTFAQEFNGGYLWSPKRKSNNAINPYYEFMREVAPGDVIFCYEGTRIRALGVAQSQCYEVPKPEEFGAAGPNWAHIGWKIEVRYFQLHEQIRPADSIAILWPLFQEQRYSPLQSSGRGNQAVYLTNVNERAATALIGLIGFEARQIVQANAVEDRSFEVDRAAPDMIRWEDHIADTINAMTSLSDTGASKQDTHS